MGGMVKNVALVDNDDDYGDYDNLIAGSCDQSQLSRTNIYIGGAAVRLLVQLW